MRGTTRLLDIGCGSGIVGLYALLKHGAHSVTFTDLLPEWIATTRCNVDIKVRAHKIDPSQVEYTKAMPFTKLPIDVIARHSLLAFNPPQLPEDYVADAMLQTIKGNPTESAFRLAGPNGLKWAGKFLKWYADLEMSRPKPDAVILLSSFLGQSNIERMIAKCQLQEVSRRRTPAVLFRGRGTFDEAKINRLSPDELKDHLLEPDGHGWWTKSLFTIRVKNK